MTSADQGLEIEIGCGNGHFLAEYAARVPGVRLVGIDVKAGRCVKAREKAARRGLANVSIVHGGAEQYLRGLLPGSVSAFHIYFPDPWPKARHRKRRFFTMERLADLHALLSPGGRLYFGTDFLDYYMQAKVLVALHGGFDIGAAAAPPEVLQSIFAQKSLAREKPIHLFTAVRRPLRDGEREQHEQQRDVHGEVQPDEKG